MGLHKKIIQSDLTTDGHLLSKNESVIIDEIVSYVASKKLEATPLLTQKENLSLQLNFLYDQFSIADDPKTHVDNKLIEILNLNEPEAFESQMIDFLMLFKSTLKTTLAITFIDAFISTFPKKILQEKTLKKTLKENKASLQSSQAIDGIDEILQELALQIPNQKKCEDLFVRYSEILDAMDAQDAFNYGNRRDTVSIDEITEASNELLDKIILIDDKLTGISNAMKAHKNESNQYFDIDENFNLLKISKKTQGLNTSVLYLNVFNTDTTVAYALYKGDQDHFLGAGNFGKVKLCQNTQTKEWCAIKTQASYVKEAFSNENKALSAFDQFHGDVVRNAKYYSVQTLLDGVELHKHISNRKFSRLDNNLNIARQAALSLVKFHNNNYLHRDIKPENFIWDDVKKELHLCDFGLAIEIGSEASLNQLSGTGTFLAPEIDDKNHMGSVPYSVKSDIYALGKTFEEIFQGVNNLPKDISLLIEKMTHPSPAERHGDLTAIANQLDDLFIQPPIIPDNAFLDARISQ